MSLLFSEKKHQHRILVKGITSRSLRRAALDHDSSIFSGLGLRSALFIGDDLSSGEAPHH